MPAENIIAIHEEVRNSGSSSSLPRGMLPNLPTANQSTNSTNRLASRTKAQPVLCITHSRALLEKVDSEVVPITPQATNARAMTAATPKTIQSSPGRCTAAGREGGTRRGGASRKAVSGCVSPCSIPGGLPTIMSFPRRK